MTTRIRSEASLQNCHWQARLAAYDPEEQSHIVELGIEVYQKDSAFIAGRQEGEITQRMHRDFQNSLDERNERCVTLEHELEKLRTQMLQEKEQQSEEYQRLQQRLRETRENTREEVEDEIREKVERLNDEMTAALETKKSLETKYHKTLEKMMNDNEKIRSECAQEKQQAIERIVEDYKQRLQNEKEHNQFSRELLDNMIYEKIENETRTLKQTIETLEKECAEQSQKAQHYYDMYEGSSKGQNYEKEIETRLSEWVEKNGEQFIVEHVGQVSQGHRGDIVLEHKDLQKRIMIDLKNKKTATKNDITQFKRDMMNERNNYHIGLLVCNGKIQTKQAFEVEEYNGKYLVYLSYYKTNQTEYLGSILFQQLGVMREKRDAVDLEKYREKLLEDYAWFSKMATQSKATYDDCVKQIERIDCEFSKQFGKDIGEYQRDCERIGKQKEKKTSAKTPKKQTAKKATKQSSISKMFIETTE